MRRNVCVTPICHSIKNKLRHVTFAVLTLFRSCHPPRIFPPPLCSSPPLPSYLHKPNKSNYETPEIKRKERREIFLNVLSASKGTEKHHSIQLCDSIVRSLMTNLRKTTRGIIGAYYGF